MIIENPFEDQLAKFGLDPAKVRYPSRSPSPVRGFAGRSLQDIKNAEGEDGDEEHIYLEDDVELDNLAQTKTEAQLKDEQAEAEAKGRQQVLTMLDDLPEADIKPPDNVLFVCKLNPVTQSEDLEIIFSRFGKVVSCEVIRDWKTGDSLQFAFVEFETEDHCIMAYQRMDNVLVDERRIKVDFSNSVSKLWNKHHRKTL